MARSAERSPPGSNEIHVDYTTHDQTDPPGTTHIKLDFKRQ